MREIKFRAWDSERSAMLPNVAIYYHAMGNSVIVRPSAFTYAPGNNWRKDDYGAYYSDNGTVNPMQYTGLKDKNGVEIYEGDIVRYQYPQKQLKHHQQLCRVIYEPKAAAFLLKPNYFEPSVKYLGDIAKSNRQYDTRTYELCEVIGNIYENHELLEKSNDQKV